MLHANNIFFEKYRSQTPKRVLEDAKGAAGFVVCHTFYRQGRQNSKFTIAYSTHRLHQTTSLIFFGWLTMTLLQIVGFQAAIFFSMYPYFAASFLREAIFLASCLVVSTFNFSLSKLVLFLIM